MIAKGCAFNQTVLDADPIIEILRNFTIRHDPWRVEDALDTLTVIPDGRVTGLIQALADEDHELRLLAIKILYSIGDDSEEALPALIESLNDEDRIVRVACVAPIAAFGQKAIAAVPILESWLDSGDEFSETTAAAAIIRIDPGRIEDVLPVLINGLESDDYSGPCSSSESTKWTPWSVLSAAAK